MTNLNTNITFNAQINKAKNVILSINNVAIAAALNAKIDDVKNKIPKINNLATNTALTAVENI